MVRNLYFPPARVVKGRTAAAAVEEGREYRWQVITFSAAPVSLQGTHFTVKATLSKFTRHINSSARGVWSLSTWGHMTQ